MKAKKLFTLISIATLVLINASVVFAQSKTNTSNIIPANDVAQAVDTSFPSDVSNLKAVAGDGKITLSWDAATDNVGVKGYKIFYGTTPVTAELGSYTLGPIDAGNVLSYDVSGLTNGTAYYFAITAYDAAGNESQFYSNEATATPNGSTTDNIAPRVVSAEALDMNTVKVVFSEAIVLPLVNPASAFSIKNDLTSTELTITDAIVDASDTSKKTVLLDTANQEAKGNYLLTAGITIKDKAGNPIISGTSDTAVFTGSAKAKTELKPSATQQTDTTAPIFKQVQATDNNTVQITFSKPVVLQADARSNFIITEASDNTKIVNINKADIGATGLQVTLTTDPLQNIKYNLIAVKVMDSSGNEMDPQHNATTFQGPTTAATSPSQQLVQNAAQDLVAQAVGNLMAKLTWSTNPTKLASIASFVLYMSTDQGATWGKGIVVSKDQNYYSFDKLKAGIIYHFKITSRDAKGNESDALQTYLTMKLPKTGPGLGLLLFGSLGGGAIFSLKKKKKAKK